MTNLRPPCVFCGGPTGKSAVTREDYWPQWLRAVDNMQVAGLRKEMRPRTVVGRSFRAGEGPALETEVEATRKGRSRLFDKTRCVCGTCNNGWMSKIQNDARQVATPAFFEGVGVLDATAQNKLASWAVMTAMVIDEHHGEHTGTPANLVRAFKLDPSDMRAHSVFVARYDGQVEAARYHHVPIVMGGPNGSLRGGAFVAMCAGHLSFVVLLGAQLHPMITQKIEEANFRWLNPVLFSRLDLSKGQPAEDGHINMLGHLFAVALLFASGAEPTDDDARLLMEQLTGPVSSGS